MPVLVVVGLVVGGDLGDVSVIVGPLFALFALLSVNRMLRRCRGVSAPNCAGSAGGRC